MSPRPSLLLALASLASLVGCDRAPAPTSTALPPLVIEAAPAQLTTDAIPVEGTALVSRRAESTLSFKTGGLIAAITVRAGDTVRAGQTLATLRLDEIDALVAQARTAEEKARRDLARVQALQAERVATLENLQDARSALDAASAALRAAEFNRAHSVIVAPTDGRILRRHAEPDELAAPGRPILIFAGDSAGWIARLGVSEREIVRLHLGDRAEISWNGAAPVPATVAQIAESTDPATRTVEVELALDAAAPVGARSGFIVDARIFPQPLPAPRTTVPLAALVEGSEHRAHVFIVAADQKTVHRVPVEVEALRGDRAYLRTALPAGSRVATTGAEFLSDGRSVTLAGAKP